MPKSVIDYSKSVIYKIQHREQPELLYVGSTTNFSKRKNEHKSRCNHLTTSLYKLIRENGGWESFKILVIKEFPCTSKTELLIEEDAQMQELKASINCYKAIGLDMEKYKSYHQEYRNKIKGSMSEYYTKYRLEHPELKDKFNCECGGKYTKASKSRHMKLNKHTSYENSK